MQQQQWRTVFKVIGIKTNQTQHYRHDIIRRFLNHFIDPSFQEVNKLFVLSFKNDAHQKSYKWYFLPTAEMKDYNVMTDGKNFFAQPVKDDLITYENSQRLPLVKEMITQLVVC